jgi:phosphatidylinositol-3-phosphatase
MKLRIAFLSLFTILTLTLAALPAMAQQAMAAQDQSELNKYKHVFVIMMENTGFTSLIGNPNAPFINLAATTYGFATNYTGVTHPSQPNYIASTSGSTNGVTTDNDVTIDVPNIVDQLESNGNTWKAYMQSIFADGNTDKLASSAGNQLYERKHNPFVSYLDVQTSTSRMANIVDFSQFTLDLAGNSVPDFSWISPDQCNDMHGRSSSDPNDLCSFSHEQDLIAAGDAFLMNTVTSIMNSRAWKGNSVIFITWDESDFPFNDVSGCCDAVPGGGHVVMLTISQIDNSARTSGVAYNHYSMLGTIQDGWRLGCLGFTCDIANVPRMTDLVGND